MGLIASNEEKLKTKEGKRLEEKDIINEEVLLKEKYQMIPLIRDESKSIYSSINKEIAEEDITRLQEEKQNKIIDKYL